MKRILFWCALIFLGTAGMAQDKALDPLRQQLAKSRETFPGTRPLIFFSQDKYAPGDTAFFRLFILAEDEKVLQERSLLTLDLIDPLGKFFSSMHVPCTKYGAANQIILPDNILPGIYTVRIYSGRWSDNYSLIHELRITNEHKLQRLAENTPTIRIFPEGGHIVPGSINRLVLRATGEIPGDCALRSAAAKIAPVSFDSDGYSTVQFIPQTDESYWIEMDVKGEKKAITLQQAEQDPLNLRVYPGPRKSRVLDISGTAARGNEKVFLILVAHREVVHDQAVRLNDEGKAQILASRGFFPDGFSELFVLDDKERILAYRPNYEMVSAPAKIEFNEIPAVAGTRQEIKAVLKLMDETGNPLSGAFAISVIHNDARIGPMLSPDPSVILHSKPLAVDWSISKEKIDMELLSIPAPKAIVRNYDSLTNRSGLTLSGVAYYTDSTAQLPYSCTILIYLHDDLIQYEVPIQPSGNFLFPKIYDFSGEDFVYYKVLHDKKDLPGVSVRWFHDSTRHTAERVKIVYAPGDLPDPYGRLRIQKANIDKSFSFFLKEKSNSESIDNANRVFEDEFQEADIVINPREYTPFETMQELILEVIPALEFRKRQRDSVVRVALTTNGSPFVAQRYSEGNPLYVIDGCMTSNTGFLMRLHPSEIVSVKIINDIGKLDKLYNLARNGVLFIQTQSPERTKAVLLKGMLVLQGISQTVNFSKSYPLDKRVPDLRSTLYWDPMIRSDSTGAANFTFRTSDIPGDHTVRVMATLDNGHLIAAEYFLKVQFKK